MIRMQKIKLNISEGNSEKNIHQNTQEEETDVPADLKFFMAKDTIK